MHVPFIQHVKLSGLKIYTPFETARAPSSPLVRIMKGILKRAFLKGERDGACCKECRRVRGLYTCAHYGQRKRTQRDAREKERGTRMETVGEKGLRDESERKGRGVAIERERERAERERWGDEQNPPRGGGPIREDGSGCGARQPH